MASRMVRLPRRESVTSPDLKRNPSMETFMVRVYPGALSSADEFISLEGIKGSTAEEIVAGAVQKLTLAGKPDQFELAETFCSGGQICKERRLEASECPVKIQILWPKVSPYIAERHRTEYRFFLCKKEPDRRTGEWMEYAEPNPVDTFLTTFLQQNMKKKEYPDLCNLPNLNEATLMDNLKRRFSDGNIYTYVGSILISVNPFKFYPIYNPKYVKMYQNRRLGELPPHIFAIADSAYHTMLRDKSNQCIVISGESGSGKTESTNLLLHHLSALSQKGYYSNGIEQTILGAGPVLEAFGNAKTVHNHNSSRFGKFIQVNYKENGMIHGAIVEKYLLEKSRIVSQSKNERNYHVFYYLLAGAKEYERQTLGLEEPQHYFYLNQSECYTLESLEGLVVDEAYELTRLQQSMEMVGFSTDTQRRIFGVLAAVLHLGNVSFKKKTDHAHHEAVSVQNIDLVRTISALLKVKESTMLEALTKRKTLAGGETVVMNYKMTDAIATRDAMAKCLYGALFDWIVMQINHAILTKREYKEHQGNSIGVLDIFGFEDFDKNSFEQFCINYANEHLHYYFNQHIFKFEQEEYLREGILWKNIEFLDNTGCLDLFSQKPTGLLCLLDEECNFPGATNETLLDKFHAQHSGNAYYEEPQMKESAFTVLHYAGKVKYQIQDFREKNSDLIRHDIVLLLKNSNLAFVRELVGYDPVAVMRWAILRAFFRAFFAFRNAGKQHEKGSNTMTRMGSVKKLKAQWDKNRPNEGQAGGDTSNTHPPLSRCVAIKSQSRLEMALSVRSSSVGKKRESNSAPSSPAHQSQGDNSFQDLQDGVTDASKRRVSSVGVTNNNVSYGSSSHSDDAGSHDENTPTNDLPVSDDSQTCTDQDLAGSTNNNHSHGLSDTDDRQVIRRASKVLMKNKSFRPKSRPPKQFRDLKALKTLAGKKALAPRTSKGKNKPPSVSAQFNYSLQKLMETLSHANPFFIRCLKSNTEKAPCVFDEDVVLRQLTYTGMLATVKIRQSGYNYRYTMEEFIQQYKVLLPRGLVSSRQDIHAFLLQFDQMEKNFQIGKNKVFLRETDKLVLDELLHCAIMQRIMSIQRWLKTRLERRRFVKLRMATVIIQTSIRCFLAKRKVHLMRQVSAIMKIQRMFRGFRERRALVRKQEAALTIQKYVRGHICRTRYTSLRRESLQAALPDLAEECLLDAAEEELVSPVPEQGDARASDTTEKQIKQSKDKVPLAVKVTDRTDMFVYDKETSRDQHEAERSRSELHDFHSSASDEGILSKELSSEEFLADKDEVDHKPDSEGSSGILEDSESEASTYDTQSDTGKSRTPSLTSPTSSVPPSPFVPDAPSSTSTPGSSRWRKRVPSDPFKDIIDFQSPSCLRRSQSHQVPEKPRAHSVAVAQGATQQPGPQDLELRVCSVSKAVSEEFLQTYKTDSIRVLDTQSPFLKAPLAKQDHFSEFEESMSLTPSLKSKQTSLSSLADGASLSSQGGISSKSPFHKARKQIKQLVTVTHHHEVRSEANQRQTLTVQGYNHGNGSRPLLQRQWKSYSESLDYKKRGVDLGPVSPDINKKSSSLSKYGSGKASDFIRHSKLSLKHILKHPSGKKKKSEDNYDSDDSQVEDTSGGSPKSGEPKNKDYFTEDTNKPKHRRKGSKKKRSNKNKDAKTTTPVSKATTVSTGTWSVSGTSQWQYPADRLVNTASELKQLEMFVLQKLQKLTKGDHRETVFDHMFRSALKQFQNNLITQISVIQQHEIARSYRDLMSNFEEILKMHAKAKGTDEEFPVTIGINAFRGFLDEFNKKKESRELPEVKLKKEKRKKEKYKENILEYNGHRYLLAQFSIHTYCELCSSHIWLLEKAYVCHVCRYTVHKKCYSKSTTKCRWPTANSDSSHEKRVFGVPLYALLEPDHQVPSIIDRLITTIELNWLYTEGLYRKGGAAAKIRELVQLIDADPAGVDLCEYHAHVLTSVMKRFLHDMPEPLLTYDFYDDLLIASEISDERERVQSLYSILEKLPPAHHDLLERLIFHLAKVAQHEEYNKMSSNGLAIIFAPSIMRTDRPLTAQESLNIVGRQSICVQAIIDEQVRKLRITLADITTLNSATHTAKSRLLQVRASMQAQDKTILDGADGEAAHPEAEEEEQMLSEQIAFFEQRKETLTAQLPALESHWSSSEEDLLNTDNHDEDTPPAEGEHKNFVEYAVSFDYPASPPKNLTHLNKRRVPLPRRQLSTPRKRVKQASRPPEGDSDEDDIGEVPKRNALASPELTAVGAEIIV